MNFTRRNFLRCLSIGGAGSSLTLKPSTEYSSQEALKDIPRVQPLAGPVGLIYYLNAKYEEYHEHSM